MACNSLFPDNEHVKDEKNMKNRRLYIGISFSVATFCLTTICSAQTTGLSIADVADSARYVLVGHIQREQILAGAPVDSTPRIEDVDGTIYYVQVIHILKGDSNLADVKILASAEEESGEGELDPMILYEGRDYLFFLCPAKTPQQFVDKYRLPDSSYFIPAYLGSGVIDISREDGLDVLIRTEHFLNVPPFSWHVKTISDWIGLLRSRIQSGSQNGTIGDKNFADILVALLEEATAKIQSRDSVGCAQTIQKVGNMIEGARYGFDRIRHVTTDSSWSLTSDVSYLLYLLPEIADGSVPHLDSLTLGKVKALRVAPRHFGIGHRAQPG
jgi:hypothetical protein